MAQLSDEFVAHKLGEISKAKDLFARAKAYRTGLEETRKINKARLIKTYLNSGLTYQKADIEALTHPTYQQIVDKVTAAIEDEAKKDWDLRILEMEFGAWRTISANQRGQM